MWFATPSQGFQSVTTFQLLRIKFMRQQPTASPNRQTGLQTPSSSKIEAFHLRIPSASCLPEKLKSYTCYSHSRLCKYLSSFLDVIQTKEACSFLAVCPVSTKKFFGNEIYDSGILTPSTTPDFIETTEITSAP